MKTNSRKWWFAAFLAVGLNIAGSVAAHAAARASLDFSKLKGTYTGSWALTATGITVPASVTVRISVPKNGRKMTVFISGTGNIFGTTVPISTTLTFQAKTRKLVSDAFLMGYFGPVSTNTTHFSGRNSLHATLSAAPGATLVGIALSGSIPYTIAINRHAVSINGSGSITSSGATQPVSIVVSAHK